MREEAQTMPHKPSLHAVRKWDQQTTAQCKCHLCLHCVCHPLQPPGCPLNLSHQSGLPSSLCCAEACWSWLSCCLSVCLAVAAGLPTPPTGVGERGVCGPVGRCCGKVWSGSGQTRPLLCWKQPGHQSLGLSTTNHAINKRNCKYHSSLSFLTHLFLAVLCWTA